MNSRTRGLFGASLLLTLLSLFADLVHAQITTDEAAYLRNRNEYLKQFSQEYERLFYKYPLVNGYPPGAAQPHIAALNEQNKLAIATLNPQLGKAVGSIQASGFNTKSSSNLRTLLPADLGFGMLDGMRLQAPGNVELVVTTEELLADFTGISNRKRSHWRALASSFDFYHKVFDPNVAFMPLVHVQVPKKHGQQFVQAVLALTRHEDWPPAIPPDDLLVLAVSGNRQRQVYLLRLPLQKSVPTIAQCKREWASFDSRYQAAMGRYLASIPKNEEELQAAQWHHAKGYEAWLRCYARLAPTQAFFSRLIVRAEALINRLPKNSP